MYISTNENNSYYKSLLERTVRHPELLQYYKTEYRDTHDAHYEYEQYLEKNRVSRWQVIKNFLFNENRKSRSDLENYLDQSKSLEDVERRHREWDRNHQLSGRINYAN
jgi:cell division septum initiation protein DivIVA